MKTLRQLSIALLSVSLFSTMSFAQTEGSDDTTTVEDVTIEEVIVPTDVEVSVNNENTVTPKPAFTFVFKSATGDAVNVLDSVRNTLTKTNLKKNVTITVNDVDIDFVVADLTNGADTNVDTVSFITVDNYYLPSKAKVNVTLPELEFSGEAYNTMPQKTYSFYVEDYIIIDDVNKEYDFNPTKSVVIESGLTYEVAADKELVCKTLVLEGGATLKNNGTVTVKDTAFYHCDKDDYYCKSGIINHGTYTTESSVFFRSYKTGKDHCNSYMSFAVQDEHKLKDITLYDGLFYAFYEGPGLGVQISSWLKGELEVVIPNTLTGASMFSSAYMADCFVRNKGSVRNDDQYLMQDLSWSANSAHNKLTFLKNPYPAMLDLKKMSYSSANANSVGQSVLLSFQQPTNSNRHITYNTFTGLTNYDGEMWKGYLMPSQSLTRVPANYNPQIAISKEYLTDLSSAQKEYEGNETTYPYIRFYCDYVDSDKALGKGNRSVVVVYFVDSEVYTDIELGRSESCDANTVYESASTYLSSFVDQSLPFIGIQRNPSHSDQNLVEIGACPIQASDSPMDVVFTLVRHLEANSSLDDSYAVKIGVLDYDLKDKNIRFECDELPNLSYSKEAIWNGKGSLYNDEEETVLAKFCTSEVEKKRFAIRFYESDELIPNGIDNTKDTDCKISYDNDKVILTGVDIDSDACLYSLSGALLSSKKVNSNSICFDIPQKGIYFVSVMVNGSLQSYKVGR